MPAGEQVLDVPGALAVANEDQFDRACAPPNLGAPC
jgi:hypothetical protein